MPSSQENNNATRPGRDSIFQTTPALDSQVVAWARYEASKGDRITDPAEEPDPPYNTAVEAMRDGWQVIQMSELKHRTREDGYELGTVTIPNGHFKI